MPTSMTDKIHQEDNNVPCDIHPKEFIKYFCPAHETVNCGHCLAFEHRSCKVSLVSDISDSFKTSQDYGDIKNAIARLLKDVNDCVSDVESNIKMVLKIGEDKVKNLKDYREKVNKYFDEREKSLLESIEQMKDMDKTRLDSLKPKCNNIKAKLGEIMFKLDAQEDSFNLFIEAKKVRKQVKGLEVSLNYISKKNNVQRYEFIKEVATGRLIAASSGLGKVSKYQTMRKQTVPIDMTSLRFTAAQNIRVMSPTGTQECLLTGMLLLPGGGRLLLADHNNRTVMLVDLQTSSMITQIELPGEPLGMCVLPGDRVAVCLQNEGSVVFLDTRGKISVGTSIKVEEKCYDIAYHNDQLVVSLGRGKIVKIDMKGKTIKRIDSVDRQTLFSKCSLNMTLTDGGQKVAFLLSDYYKNTITKLDIDLNIIQTFNDPAMQTLKGITAIGNQLLICSYGGHKILSLDLSSGKIIQLLGVSDGINYPYSTVYSPEQNKLYITSYRNGKSDLNNIVQVCKANELKSNVVHC